MIDSIVHNIAGNWPYWIVSLTLIVAAVIDGIKLKVPNWITFPMILSGWIYSSMAYAFAGDAWYVGLGWSMAGTALGLGLLLPAYAIGGMVLAMSSCWRVLAHGFIAETHFLHFVFRSLSVD